MPQAGAQGADQRRRLRNALLVVVAVFAAVLLVIAGSDNPGEQRSLRGEMTLSFAEPFTIDDIAAALPQQLVAERLEIVSQRRIEGLDHTTGVIFAQGEFGADRYRGQLAATYEDLAAEELRAASDGFGTDPEVERLVESLRSAADSAIHTDAANIVRLSIVADIAYLQMLRDLPEFAPAKSVLPAPPAPAATP